MRDPRIVVGVLGLAINKEGNFLHTLRHSPEHPAVHKKWQIPGGGMEFGESAEVTVIRELQEELGVDAIIIHPHPIVRTNTWEEHKSHVVLITYLVDIGDQKITLNEEATEWRWIAESEIDDVPAIVNNNRIIHTAHDIVAEHNLLDKL
jgi:8-oxo-dGTP diphosphatase